MQNFQSKVAVITGGASGIGLAVAKALAKAGSKLVLADIEAKALDPVVAAFKQQGTDVIGVVTDVSDRSAVEQLKNRAYEQFAAVDILFNNAGIAVFGATQDMSHNDWLWSVNVNLWGPIHGVECFVPQMIQQGREGHVLFTASFAGLAPNRALGPYNVTKAGVVALAESLHKDLRGTGIGVSVLCPMRVTTNIDQSMRNRPASLGGKQANRTYTPEEREALAGRTLQVEQVAELVMAGMRRNDLYIHTHQEAKEFVERRAERMLKAFINAL